MISEADPNIFSGPTHELMVPAEGREVPMENIVSNKTQTVMKNCISLGAGGTTGEFPAKFVSTFSSAAKPSPIRFKTSRNSLLNKEDRKPHNILLAATFTHLIADRYHGRMSLQGIFKLAIAI